MVAIVDLQQRVAQQIRRCPEPTLIQAYRDAARQFCLESRWLRRNAEPVLTAADDPQYQLYLGSADAGLEIVSVKTIVCDNFGGTPQSQWRIGPGDPTTWNPGVQPGAPQSYAYVPEAQVAIFPTPDGEYQLSSVVCVQPTMSTEELPDDLMTKWDRQLAAGALAYLFAIPGQPWSDPRQAMSNRVTFQAAINNAKGDEQRAYNMGTVVARIPRLFRFRR